jgi:hypothetical protein
LRRRVRIDRRSLLFFWVAISSASPHVDAGAAPAPSCPGCNVVLVTFDALRADRLGLYGSERPTSPAIDFLGRRSTVFETASRNRRRRSSRCPRSSPADSR